MTHNEQSDSHTTLNDIENPSDGHEEKPIKVLSPFNKGTPSMRRNEGGSNTAPLNDRDIKCGEISTIYELEQYYISHLGWNKYHRMKKEGNKIRISRPDRRVVSHLLALLSSLSLYIWHGDLSQGIRGISADLQALILANYAFITAYAGEILIGPYSEVVDAKSERYGIMVTRAIDKGYVRGFHVPNGEWLMYKNGEEGSEVHEITKTEVNATCNSVVTEDGNNMKIRVIDYFDEELETLDWEEPTR